MCRLQSAILQMTDSVATCSPMPFIFDGSTKNTIPFIFALRTWVDANDFGTNKSLLRKLNPQLDQHVQHALARFVAKEKQAWLKEKNVTRAAVESELYAKKVDALGGDDAQEADIQAINISEVSIEVELGRRRTNAEQKWTVSPSMIERFVMDEYPPMHISKSVIKDELRRFTIRPNESPMCVVSQMETVWEWARDTIDIINNHHGCVQFAKISKLTGEDMKEFLVETCCTRNNSTTFDNVGALNKLVQERVRQLRPTTLDALKAIMRDLQLEAGSEYALGSEIEPVHYAPIRFPLWEVTNDLLDNQPPQKRQRRETESKDEYDHDEHQQFEHEDEQSKDHEKRKSYQQNTKHAQQATTRARGVCAHWNFEKGFGFIHCNDGSDDIFVHQTELQMQGYRSLNVNDHVEFDISSDVKGRRLAVNVTGPNGAYLKGKAMKRAANSSDTENAGKVDDKSKVKGVMDPKMRKSHVFAINKILDRLVTVQRDPDDPDFKRLVQMQKDYMNDFEPDDTTTT